MNPIAKRRGRPPKPVPLYTYEGVSRTLAEWESIKRLPPGVLAKRMKEGMSFEEALNKVPLRAAVQLYPDRSHEPISDPKQPGGWKPDLVRYNGEWVRLRVWCDDTGISQTELSARIHVLGWDLHRALHEPKE